MSLIFFSKTKYMIGVTVGFKKLLTHPYQNYTQVTPELWQFRMGLNNDEFLPFETRLHLG